MKPLVDIALTFFALIFFDITLTFFDSSFNSFLFEVTFFSGSSKSVFLTKLGISLLLVKLANLVAKFSVVKLLNFRVVTYLS